MAGVQETDYPGNGEEIIDQNQIVRDGGYFTDLPPNAMELEEFGAVRWVFYRFIYI